MLYYRLSSKHTHDAGCLKIEPTVLQCSGNLLGSCQNGLERAGVEHINSRLPLPLAFLGNLTVIGGLVAAWLHYHSTSYPPLQNFVYNADALYLPALYADILNGSSLTNWNLPPSSYVFPDLFLYALVRVATSSLHASIVVFGLIQYLFFAFGLMLLTRQTMPHSPGLARNALVALMSVLFVVFIDRLEFYSQMIFVSAHHFGVVLMIPYVLTVLCRLVSETSSKPLLLIALCVLSFLTSASDGLYLIQVAAPLVGSLAILFLMNQMAFKRVLLASSAVFVAGLSGVAFMSVTIYRNKLVGSYLFRPYSIRFSLWQLLDALLTTWSANPLHAVLTSGFLVLCTFVLVRQATQYFRDKNSLNHAAVVLVSSYFVLAFVANLLALIVSGVFVDRNGFRYLLPFLVFPGFWGLPLLLRIPKIIKPAFFEWGVWGILALSVLFLLKRVDIQQVARLFTDAYYPAYIQCIDENTAQLGIRDGIAQYWQARPISMLTQNELEVVQVTGDLSPFHWVNNPAGYDMQPEFAVIDLSLPKDHPFRLDEDLITSRFGPPDAIFQCDRNKVLVYRWPGSAFGALFEHIP